MGKCSLYITAPTLLLIGVLAVNTGEGDDEQSEYPKTKKSFYYVDEISHKKDWCVKVDSCKLLAELGYHEARGESDVGVVATMHVAVNRKENNEYFARQSTLKDVILAKHQFTYIWDGSRKRGMKDKEQLDRMLVLAYDVLHNNLKDVTSGSLYYHSNHVNPKWNKKLEYTVTIGNHLFYK